MFVHLPKTVQVSASGAVLRPVICENCACQYLYRLSRRITETHGAAPDVRAIERRVKGVIQSAIDPVPCPDCGYLQRAMVRTLRWERLAILLLIAIPVTPICAVLIFLGLSPEFQILFPIGVILAILAGGTLVPMAIVTILMDHNSREKMEYRLRLPTILALRRADFADLPADLFSEPGLSK